MRMSSATLTIEYTEGSALQYYDGTAWQDVKVRYYNGTEWVLC